MNRKKSYFLVLIILCTIGIYSMVFLKQNQVNKIHFLEADLLLYDRLLDVKDAADLIIVGEVTDAEYWGLVLDEPQFAPLPMTDYSVKILLVIEGDTKGLSSIIVEMTGGIADDEIWVIRGNPLMDISKKYVMFLSRTNEGRYIFTGGPTGRYIVENDRVFSLGEKYDDASVYTENLKTHGQSLNDFIKEIKSLA